MDIPWQKKSWKSLLGLMAAYNEAVLHSTPSTVQGDASLSGSSLAAARAPVPSVADHSGAGSSDLVDCFSEVESIGCGSIRRSDHSSMVGDVPVAVARPSMLPSHAQPSSPTPSAHTAEPGLEISVHGAAFSGSQACLAGVTVDEMFKL